MRLCLRMTLCAAAALLAAGLALTVTSAFEPRTQTLAQESAAGVVASRSEDELSLFPDIAKGEVVSLSVVAPERSFEFEREDGEVSVNGNEADGDAFSLLVRKVVTLPVSGREAFEPEGEADLVIALSTDDAQYTARFYRDAQDGERSVIVCSTPEATLYRETDGWRVGTLLMACDGTRIFDEEGFETPVE